MPSRMTGSKNYRFDRYLRGVGRIQRSSGTSKAGEFRRRDAILTKLLEGGHVETLRLFKEGALTVDDLVEADRHGALSEVPERLRLRKGLATEVERWLPTSASAKRSVDRYRVSWRKFIRHAREGRHLTDSATVGDLSSVDYSALRSIWDGSGADWNRARAMISAFLSAFLGHVHHPFRLRVMGRYPRARESVGRIPDTTPAGFWRIVDAAADHAKASFVAMVVLGVGPGEYLNLRSEDLSAEQLTVRVNGTKTQHRQRTVAVDERLWHWIERAVPSSLKYRWLNIYWKRACEAAGVKELRMYDLRHLSAQYAGDFGVSDRDLTVHLGHGNPAMSHRYSRRSVSRSVANAIANVLGTSDLA